MYKYARLNGLVCFGTRMYTYIQFTSLSFEVRGNPALLKFIRNPFFLYKNKNLGETLGNHKNMKYYKKKK